MYAPITKDISEAVRVIKEGRVVAFPTGTSYGLAVDALQGYALQRLRNLKRRPQEKTFTVFVQPALVQTYFEVTPEERDFLATHQNEALTLLLTPKEDLKHLAQDGRVGLRVIDDPVMKELAEQSSVPLTATSANVSGDNACYTAQCITDMFPGTAAVSSEELARTGNTTYDLSLGCILDGGTLEEGRVSTIIRIDNGIPTVIREGSFRLS